MLRALLLGVLAVSASACGKSSTESSAKVVPGQAAGKVLEVKGSVQVKRGAETKPLAVGDSVEATDVVVTGADGSVAIELAHNSARWELGPNKEQKVSSSIAWNATKATAEEVDQATAAAGRPAERSAAGTVAMAGEGAAPAEPAPAAAEMAPAPAAAPAAEKAEPDMAPKGGGGAPPERTRRRAAPKAAATADVEEVASADDEAPTPRTRRGAVMKKTDSSADAVASAESAKAPPPPPPPGGDAGGGGGTTRGGKVGVMARSADPVASAASAALGAKSAALGKCMADAGAKDEVTMTITIANGKPSVKLVSKAAISAGLDKCLKTVVAGVTFTGTTTITKIVRP